MFVAVMAALGNVFSFISIHLAPLIPSIPLGPVTVSLALDLSHLTTFIAALFGGPVLGGATGLIGGLVAAFEFGFSKGNLVTGFGLPLGKALTGITAGLVMTRMRVGNNRLMTVMATVVSYIPEGIFTALLFMAVFPLFMGLPSVIAVTITSQIIVKAFVEMILMGFIFAGLLGNHGFNSYLKGYFQ
jgi:hypothetical protein